MLDRVADTWGLLTADVSAGVATALAALLTVVGSATYLLTDLWTEDKVRQGVEQHEQRVEPRLDRIEEKARTTQAAQEDTRRDVGVILTRLDSQADTLNDIKRMQERLLERELRQ